MNRGSATVLYSLSLTSIGRTTHAAGTAAAHLKYILRSSAAVAILGRGIPGNAVEAAAWMNAQELGDRANARVCDGVLLALPHQLTHRQRMRLLRDWCNAVSTGAPYVVAIHRPARDGDDRNHHAHAVFRDRDPTTGKRVMHSTKIDFAERMRISWEDYVNAALESAGIDARTDRHSYAARGIDRMPQIHAGPAATAAARRAERGGLTPTGNLSIAEPLLRSASRIVPNSVAAHSPSRVVDYPRIDQGRTRADENARRQAVNTAHDRADTRAAMHARLAAARATMTSVGLGTVPAADAYMPRYPVDDQTNSRAGGRNIETPRAAITPAVRSGAYARAVAMTTSRGTVHTPMMMPGAAVVPVVRSVAHAQAMAMVHGTEHAPAAGLPVPDECGVVENAHLASPVCVGLAAAAAAVEMTGVVPPITDGVVTFLVAPAIWDAEEPSAPRKKLIAGLGLALARAGLPLPRRPFNDRLVAVAMEISTLTAFLGARNREEVNGWIERLTAATRSTTAHRGLQEMEKRQADRDSEPRRELAAQKAAGEESLALDKPNKESGDWGFHAAAESRRRQTAIQSPMGPLSSSASLPPPAPMPPQPVVAAPIDDWDEPSEEEKRAKIDDMLRRYRPAATPDPIANNPTPPAQASSQPPPTVSPPTAPLNRWPLDQAFRAARREPVPPVPPVRAEKQLGPDEVMAALRGSGIIFVNQAKEAVFVATPQRWDAASDRNGGLDGLGVAFSKIGLRVRQQPLDGTALRFKVLVRDLVAVLVAMGRTLFEDWIGRLTQASKASREQLEAYRKRQQQEKGQEL